MLDIGSEIKIVTREYLKVIKVSMATVNSKPAGLSLNVNANVVQLYVCHSASTSARVAYNLSGKLPVLVCVLVWECTV